LTHAVSLCYAHSCAPLTLLAWGMRTCVQAQAQGLQGQGHPAAGHQPSSPLEGQVGSQLPHLDNAWDGPSHSGGNAAGHGLGSSRQCSSRPRPHSPPWQQQSTGSAGGLGGEVQAADRSPVFPRSSSSGGAQPLPVQQQQQHQRQQQQYLEVPVGHGSSSSSSSSSSSDSNACGDLGLRHASPGFLQKQQRRRQRQQEQELGWEDGASPDSRHQQHGHDHGQQGGRVVVVHGLAYSAPAARGRGLLGRSSCSTSSALCGVLRSMRWGTARSRCTPCSAYKHLRQQLLAP